MTTRVLPAALRIILLVALTWSANAQMKMNVQQLREFLVSSVKLKQPDKQVAQYLKVVTLTNKLDEDTYSSLLGLGIGDKTAGALRSLFDASRTLAAAPPPPVKPAAKPIPAPSAAEQKKLIDDVRDYALNYVANLPNFICTQLTRRYYDPSGLEFWSQQDTIVAQLTFFDQKEDYKVKLINNRPVDTTFDKLDGSTSQGEFGSMMKEIFEPESEAEFQWLRWATLGGRRAHVISYFVRQDRSKWSIRYQRSDSIVPAYKGLIYVDRDSRAVLRITLEADSIPPDFPIQQVGLVLDYDFVDISGQRYMLPLKFSTRMREAKFLSKNEVEFRTYRKYGTESSITFEDEPVDEPSKDRVEAAPAN
jgi:hypothetical protein